MRAEYAERQVLDWEFRVAVGGCDPAQARRIMRCVGHLCPPRLAQPSAHRLGEIYLGQLAQGIIPNENKVREDTPGNPGG
jgi:hypothetical protein